MAFSIPNYTYRVELVRVIDGDTIDVDIDLGFNIRAQKRLRFLDIDTSELRGGTEESKAHARAARDRVQELLGSAHKIYVQTVMDSTGKYGRLLAHIWYESPTMTQIPVCLNEQLIQEGFQKKVD